MIAVASCVMIDGKYQPAVALYMGDRKVACVRDKRDVGQGFSQPNSARAWATGWYAGYIKAFNAR